MPPRSNKDRNEALFETFGEYWHFVRCMTREQRDVLFKSLPHNDRRKLRSSFKQGGWIDLMMRNKIDTFIDHIKVKFNYDLIEVKSKVVSGKSVYIPREVWEYIVEEIGLIDNDSKHSQFVLGGIQGVVCKNNEQVVLLLSNNKDKNEGD